MKNKTTLFLLLLSLLFANCENSKKPKVHLESPQQETEAPKIIAPDFNEDSAYLYLKKQVDFGPRAPGTKAHANCAIYLKNKLKSFGLKVTLQETEQKTFDDKKFLLKNIFASYNPESKTRILLTAHWDCRPFADQDTKNISLPIDGANDGASGVAVLLEIARVLSTKKVDIGVDFLLSDLEDYGQPASSMTQQKENTWCLGTQYWAANKPTDYKPKYGILLDMVGGQNPIFPMEGTSMAYAPDIVQSVWKTAANLGYGSYFTTQQTGQTTDDHLYINSIARIPCIDIVNMDPATGTYPAFHHTHADNLSIIEKSTLKMVGQTVLQVIYEEPS